MSVIINKIQSSFKHLAVNLTIIYSFWNGLLGSWDQNEIFVQTYKISKKSETTEFSKLGTPDTGAVIPSCGGSLCMGGC